MSELLTPCKLVLLGNGSVGKTSLCARFKDDGFHRVYKQTIGVDFYERQMKIRERSVVLQVWDVGGQSVASGMLPQYIFGAAVLFLCYDVTDTNSFADAQDWLGLAKLTLDKVCEEEEGKMVPSNNEKNLNSKIPRPAIFVVGNKVDLEHLRRVTKDQHDRFITSNSLTGGFFVSARSGENVLSSFYQAAANQLGIKLDESEVNSLQRILTVDQGAGEGDADSVRTDFADEIERQDKEAMEKRKRGEKENCCQIT